MSMHKFRHLEGLEVGCQQVLPRLRGDEEKGVCNQGSLPKKLKVALREQSLPRLLDSASFLNREPEFDEIAHSNGFMCDY